jgi:hypothetical protein
MLEWNNGEIVIPRYPTSTHSLLSVDICELKFDNEEESIKIREKIAEYVVHWNVSMRYKSNPSDISKEGNCQHFVDGFLKKFGIVLEFKGTALGTYLDNVKKNGNGQAMIRLSPDLLEKLKIGPKDFENLKTKSSSVFHFQSHFELDEFCSYILKIEPNFPADYKYEWMLLKGFDRSYWLRHIQSSKKKKQNLQFQPKDEEGKYCPFGDPQMMSFLKF